MKDTKYSLEIMQAQIKSPYISPENKYAFEASIEALGIKAKIEELLGVYESLLINFKEKTGERNSGKIYMTEQAIRDFKDLLGIGN